VLQLGDQLPRCSTENAKIMDWETVKTYSIAHTSDGIFMYLQVRRSARILACFVALQGLSAAQQLSTLVTLELFIMYCSDVHPYLLGCSKLLTAPEFMTSKCTCFIPVMGNQARGARYLGISFWVYWLLSRRHVHDNVPEASSLWDMRVEWRVQQPISTCLTVCC
jgi:hypothetical protein